MQPLLMLLYMVLFTTATGSFSSLACKLSVNKPFDLHQQRIEQPAQKNTAVPLMNPLQVLSSKFL